MSLGLVCYDDSDESENEVDSTTGDRESRTKTIETKNVSVVSKTTLEKQSRSENVSDEEESVENLDQSRSLHLPKSKVGLSLLNSDIDVKSLTSAHRRHGPVKITIPSLSEVESEPSKKKLKPAQKGSGLFALLPTPKNSLIPQSVVNRTKASSTSTKPRPAPGNLCPLLPNPVRKTPVTTANTGKSSMITCDDSGDEEESSGTVDFFSLDDKEDDVVPAPADIDVLLPEVRPSVQDKSHTDMSSEGEALSFNTNFQPSKWLEPSVSRPTSSFTLHQQTADHYTTSEFMSVSNNDLALNQEAMQQLCGRRDRLKMGEVSVIDVSGDAIMPDSREWLTKQLTEETVHRPSHKRKDGPTSQQKRKHQITYLAFQAKENELELKNQWSNNRMSRKQTQSKYGF